MPLSISFPEAQECRLIELWMATSIAIRSGRAVPEEMRASLADFVQAIALDRRHWARSHFGLPVQKGRPAKVARQMQVLEYFTLARAYGHTKERAMALTADAIGYSSVTSVERIVSGSTFTRSADQTQEAFILWLEKLFTKRRISLPPKPAKAKGRNQKLGNTPSKKAATFGGGKKSV